MCRQALRPDRLVRCTERSTDSTSASVSHAAGKGWGMARSGRCRTPVSVLLADAVYNAVESTRGDVALAVHTAVRAARSWGIESSRWAAYVHKGG